MVLREKFRNYLQEFKETKEKFFMRTEDADYRCTVNRPYKKQNLIGFCEYMNKTIF